MLPDAFGINQDRVVLAREPAPRDAAGAILPDELVQEIRGTEDGIELHLDVMRGAPVQMQVERGMIGHDAMNLDQSRMQERQERLQAAAPAIIERFLMARAAPDFARREGRIKIDQVAKFPGHFCEEREVIRLNGDVRESAWD